MKLRIFIAATLIAGAALPASALTPAEVKKCNAMAASFGAKKAEVLKAKEALEKMAADTELAGETWEAAEEMKLLSPAAAKEADDAKAHWETLKGDFYKKQIALQSQVQMLNKDMAAYNRSCASD